MTEYISFIKEKKSCYSIQNEESQEDNSMKNLFEEENAFIGMMKPDNKEINDEGKEELRNIENEEIKENEEENKKNDEEKNYFLEKEKTKNGDKIEKNQKDEESINESKDENQKTSNVENKENQGLDQLKKNVDFPSLTENLEVNSKKRKILDANVLKIFAKITKS